MRKNGWSNLGTKQDSLPDAIVKCNFGVLRTHAYHDFNYLYILQWLGNKTFQQLQKSCLKPKFLQWSWNLASFKMHCYAYTHVGLQACLYALLLSHTNRYSESWYNELAQIHIQVSFGHFYAIYSTYQIACNIVSIWPQNNIT